jgi:hypothetical protein
VSRLLFFPDALIDQPLAADRLFALPTHASRYAPEQKNADD